MISTKTHLPFTDLSFEALSPQPVPSHPQHQPQAGKALPSGGSFCLLWCIRSPKTPVGNWWALTAANRRSGDHRGQATGREWRTVDDHNMLNKLNNMLNKLWLN